MSRDPVPGRTKGKRTSLVLQISSPSDRSTGMPWRLQRTLMQSRNHMRPPISGFPWACTRCHHTAKAPFPGLRWRPPALLPLFHHLRPLPPAAFTPLSLRPFCRRRGMPLPLRRRRLALRLATRNAIVEPRGLPMLPGPLDCVVGLREGLRGVTLYITWSRCFERRSKERKRAATHHGLWTHPRPEAPDRAARRRGPGC